MLPRSPLRCGFRCSGLQVFLCSTGIHPCARTDKEQQPSRSGSRTCRAATTAKRPAAPSPAPPGWHACAPPLHSSTHMRALATSLADLGLRACFANSLHAFDDFTVTGKTACGRRPRWCPLVQLDSAAARRPQHVMGAAASASFLIQRRPPCLPNDLPFGAPVVPLV